MRVVTRVHTLATGFVNSSLVHVVGGFKGSAKHAALVTGRFSGFTFSRHEYLTIK